MIMPEHFYAVVMAGGGGTRLWPLSRRATPKQMLSFGGNRSLFQLAIDRLVGLFPLDHIFVVTIADQAETLKAEYPGLPSENYLVEPMPRGTASVIGLAAVALAHLDPQATMAVVTADHIIQNVPGFLDTLRAGFETAQAGYLVTLGIQPASPSTGYGYIESGEAIGIFAGAQALRVIRFTEKPDEPTARKFLAQGNYFWNSGMFIWQVVTILAEFKQNMPDLSGRLDLIARDWGTENRQQRLMVEWPLIHPETIDFGIMEKALRVAVIPASELEWSDVGSWDSLFGVIPADSQGNIILGANFLGLDTSSTLVVSKSSGRLIVTIGLQDVVVIDSGDALLICPKDESQKVKEVVNRLKQAGLNDYL
jgi:mannose-1-phosphate guanylyltransferase